MSVCISLMAQAGTAIANVSDTKVGFGDFSADNLSIKTQPISEHCRVMMAGNDIEHAIPILDRARELLMQINKPSVKQVANAIDDAYADRLHSEITNRVLRKYGFNVTTFLDKGKRKCTPSAYLNLCNLIAQVSLSLKFIVTGWDKTAHGHIYCIDGESAPKNYDSIGMWAIGSGSHAALSLLAFHIENKHLMPIHSTKEQCIFFALAAKFMAESCSDVGRESTVVVVNEIGKEPWVPDYRYIREIWKNESAPRVPRDLLNRLDQMWPSFNRARTKPSVYRKSKGRQ